jgi:hypothetical protein
MELYNQPKSNRTVALIYGRALSGLYLVFFLTQHIAAVFWARSAFAPFDTNVYWAAAVVKRPPLSLYFLPYYGLAVLSVFAHIAAALHFRALGSAFRLPAVMLGAGAFASALILAALTGLLTPVNLPPAYQAFLLAMEGGLR